jgi:sulfonate transport system substrate-binding protein
MNSRVSRRSLLQATGIGTAAAATGLLSACKKSAPPVKLTLGDQQGGLQTLLDIAGELSNLTYQIEWAQFGAAAPLFEALNAGAVDAGIGGDAPFVFFMATRPAAKAIAALNYTASSSAAAAILVRPNSGIHDIHDLVGKQVAVVRGSTGQYITLAALQQAGLPLDAVHFSYLQPGDSMTAVLQGGVDAWGTWTPYVPIGELHYGLQPMTLPANLVAGLGFIVATDQAISAKHDALRDFLDRFNRARKWAAANRDSYAAAFSKQTGVPLDVAKDYAQTTYEVAPIDGKRIASVQQLTDLYAAAKLLPSSFPIDFAFDKSFSESS